MTELPISSPSAEATPSGKPSVRIASIDVFRGVVMFLMLLQMVQLPKLADKLLKQGTSWSRVWETIAFHTEHVVWEGGSLHDMIQPGFSFLVGAAMAFSLSNRRRKGQSWSRMFFHATVRSLILIALGVILRNLKFVFLKTDVFTFRFDDTLCQIGLGYLALFLIAGLPRLWHYVGFVAILVGWWLAFVAYPAPSADFDYVSVGVSADWPHHNTGIAAHWNKNSNLAAAFDRWFLNLFPRDKPYRVNEGGYATLNFVPTLATMLLGLIAGAWLRDESSMTKRSARFVAAIALCFCGAWLLDHFGLCPIVKRIWTPSWTLYSGGWCLAFLYFFHLLCDFAGLKRWAFPMIVIGANSIAAYVMSYALVPTLREYVDKWPGFLWKESKLYGPHLTGLVVLVVIWLILYLMNRFKLFVRI